MSVRSGAFYRIPGGVTPGGSRRWAIFDEFFLLTLNANNSETAGARALKFLLEIVLIGKFIALHFAPSCFNPFAKIGG